MKNLINITNQDGQLICKKVLDWKLKYIESFNKMEGVLNANSIVV